MRKRRTIEHQPANVQGHDAVLLSIAATLRAGLSWLDNCYAFGRIIRGQNGERKLVTYAGKNEYIDLVPTGGLGNYIALRTEVVNTVNDAAHYAGLLREDALQVDLVAFFDFRKIGFTDQDSVTESNIAEQIRTALRGTTDVGLIIETSSLLTMPEDVFSPAALDDTDDVLLRRPYGCLSMSLTATATFQFYCLQVNQN